MISYINVASNANIWKTTCFHHQRDRDRQRQGQRHSSKCWHDSTLMWLIAGKNIFLIFTCHGSFRSYISKLNFHSVTFHNCQDRQCNPNTHAATTGMPMCHWLNRALTRYLRIFTGSNMNLYHHTRSRKNHTAHSSVHSQNQNIKDQAWAKSQFCKCKLPITTSHSHEVDHKMYNSLWKSSISSTICPCLFLATQKEPHYYFPYTTGLH